jgi:hypothetical protein
MNSRQGQRHRDTERQADAKSNPSVKNGLGDPARFLGKRAAEMQKKPVDARKLPSAVRLLTVVPT